MRTQHIVHAVLLSLGLAFPAWASPRALPPLPAPEQDALPAHESRQPPVLPAVPPRGQMLYENHCMACHESVVHIRSRQLARSLPQLREQVRRWADYLQLRWSGDEVEEVVRYLDRQYYRFERR